MKEKMLGVLGMGLATDGYADIHAMAQELGVAERVGGAGRIGEEGLAGFDLLTQWAMRALHQAATMAGGFEGRETALLVVTQWGMVDATAGYLESMLEAEGRYASPRHFTRSVYSAAASALAIHFGIHGACQTLAFDGDESPVDGALAQAWRLLAARRAERVAIVWADRGGELARDLAERAVRDLGRRELARYGGGNLGYGATAMVVGINGEAAALGRLPIPVGILDAKGEMKGKAFPMDGAVGLVRGILGGHLFAA